MVAEKALGLGTRHGGKACWVTECCGAEVCGVGLVALLLGEHGGLCGGAGDGGLHAVDVDEFAASVGGVGEDEGGECPDGGAGGDESEASAALEFVVELEGDEGCDSECGGDAEEEVAREFGEFFVAVKGGACTFHHVGVFLGGFAGLDGEEHEGGAEGAGDERGHEHGAPLRFPCEGDDEEDGDDERDGEGEVNDEGVEAVEGGWSWECEGIHDMIIRNWRARVSRVAEGRRVAVRRGGEIGLEDTGIGRALAWVAKC